MPWLKVAIFAISLSGLVVWASRAIVPEDGQVPQQAAVVYDDGADIGTRIWRAYKSKNPVNCFWADGTGLRLILAYAKYQIEVTEDQEPEWQALRDEMTAAGPVLREFCRTLKSQGVTKPPRNWEDLGEVADPLRDLDARLRPKFEDLYAALSDAQRERIDRMMNRRREPL